MRALLIIVHMLCLLLQSGCEQAGEDKVIDTGARLDDAELITFKHNKEGNVHAQAQQVIRFGFDLRASPREDARQYLPFLDYLQRETGYPFELRFTPAGRDIIDELGHGEVHLAAVGATSYLKAREKYGVKILARGLNKEGRAEYRSMIVVRPDAKIKRIEELRGKRMAFGDINSTQGHLIPRIIFAEKGIELEQFASYQYTVSHRNCAKAVVTAQADACGMQDTMAKHLQANGDIRIVHVSSYFPSSGVAINKDVDKKVRDRIRRALLEFDPVGHDSNGLYNWHKTEMPLGFTVAEDADYEHLYNWLVRLGLMDGSPPDTGDR